MPYINKYKDIEFALPDIHTKFAGEVRMEAFKGVEFPKGSGQVFEIAGTRREVLPWGPNIILDQGLDYYSSDGNTDMAADCVVGTSSQAESASDSGCIAPLAYAAQVYGTRPADAQATPPFYGWQETKYRFVAGFGGGNVNINEISICQDGGDNLTNVNNNSTARALTKDGQGDPSTVPVLVDEYLDVFYRRRQYPGYVDAAGNPQDGSGTIDIGGTGYNYTIRPARVTDSAWGGWANFEFAIVTGSWNSDFDRGQVFSSDAVMGPVTGTPTATESDVFWYQHESGLSGYTNGQYYQSGWAQLPLDQGNMTGGIKGLTLNNSRGLYQVIFNNAIPKDATKIFTYYQKWSWTRKTLP